jgi:beta-ketodecanoyl-[acyl-carrier-protein] synthase
MDINMKKNTGVVISGSGIWTPEYTITNEELVESYNAYAEAYNRQHTDAIRSGERNEMPLSSARFIEKASGIRSRYVYSKEGILDINRMRPKFPQRKEEDLSLQAEMALHAARNAMIKANKTASDIDAVIVSCAYTQRAFPAIAVEVQAALGIKGFGFDMLMACSAATFGLHRAYDSIVSGSARCVLAINPELVTPMVNWCDRDSHFIFGDVSTAVIMERAETCTSENGFDILGTKAQTIFSSNIRSDFGHLSRATDEEPYGPDKLFHQQGRKVFEEVSPVAALHIRDHLQSLGYKPEDVKRYWLHQANINMNRLVIKHLFNGEAPSDTRVPVIIDRYANTASAGVIIVFDLFSDDLDTGDIGIICSFGAGYSVGSLVLRKR